MKIKLLIVSISILVLSTWIVGQPLKSFSNKMSKVDSISTSVCCPPKGKGNQLR